VGGRALGHGHPDQRDHVRGHDRPGLHEGDELRRLLLRPALRDDRAQPDPRALLLPLRRLHRLPVPGEALRLPDPDPHEPALPALARAVGRRHALRAVPRPLRDPRLERGPDRGPRGRGHDRLRRLRRQPLGHLDGRCPDGPHLVRHLPLRRRRDREAPGDGGRAGRPRPRPGRRPARDGRPLARPLAALHALERPRRRDVPRHGLLRVRPEPGPALPLGPDPDREPPLAPLQRLPQGPDAVPHPPHRRPRLRVLPLPRDAAPLEPGGAREARGEGRSGRARPRPGRRSRPPTPPAGARPRSSPGRAAGAETSPRRGRRTSAPSGGSRRPREG
jgi:hypothetical protein